MIYVLKNRSNSVNIDNQNRLHPFYMVYIGNDGEVICDHLSPKQMLDKCVSSAKEDRADSRSLQPLTRNP